MSSTDRDMVDPVELGDVCGGGLPHKAKGDALLPNKAPSWPPKPTATSGLFESPFAGINGAAPLMARAPHLPNGYYEQVATSGIETKNYLYGPGGHRVDYK
jgi:hypothetical protein